MKRRNSQIESYTSQKKSPVEEVEPEEDESDSEEEETLPITAYRDEILESIQKNKVTVLIGETGSGKSTQIPKYIYESGLLKDSCMVVSQPRRIAAVSLAQRFAEETHTTVGNEVGYVIRFDDHTDSRTKVKYITDGCLMMECLTDSSLSHYQYIMIDEAHERSMHTDILLGLLKDTIAKREDVHILITSATINTEQFATFFDTDAIIEIPGRQYPISIIHNRKMEQESVNNTIAKGIEVFQKLHLQEGPGHVLFFLPGQSDIESTHKKIQEWYDHEYSHHDQCMRLKIYDLYGAMPSNRQREVFAPCASDTRKLILCTNICETSLTVNNVKFVIDTGFKKEKIFLPKQGIESLVYSRISQINAIQRAGRAGRTCPGKCYRLYSTSAFEEFQEKDTPEIQKNNLINTVLYLKALNIQDVLSFPFMDPPEAHYILLALKQLYLLECLDASGHITSKGKEISMLPLEPTLARTLLLSLQYDCVEECIKIAAMLSTEGVFYTVTANSGSERTMRIRETHAKLMHYYGDHITYLNIFDLFVKNGRSRQWCEDHYLHYRACDQAYRIYTQIKGILEAHQYKVQPSSLSRVKLYKSICECICRGYVFNIAKNIGGSMYRTVIDLHEGGGTRVGSISPSSAINVLGQQPEFIVYHEATMTSKLFFKNCVEVNGDVVLDICKTIKELEKTSPIQDDSISCSFDTSTLLTTSIPVELPKEEKKEVKPPSTVTPEMIQATRERYLKMKQEMMDKKKKKKK